MKKIFLCLFIYSFLLNTSFASTFKKTNILLSEKVASNFVNYLRGNIGYGNNYAYIKPVSFWITEDGKNSYFWYTEESVQLPRYIKIEKAVCERTLQKKCFLFANKRKLIFSDLNNNLVKVNFSSKFSDEKIKNLLTETNLFEKLSSNFVKKSYLNFHSPYVVNRVDE